MYIKTKVPHIAGPLVSLGVLVVLLAGGGIPSFQFSFPKIPQGVEFKHVKGLDSFIFRLGSLCHVPPQFHPTCLHFLGNNSV